MRGSLRALLAAVAVPGAAVGVISAGPAHAATEGAPLVGRYLTAPAGTLSTATDVAENGAVAGSLGQSGGGTQLPVLWQGGRLVRLPVPEEAAGGIPPATGYAAHVEGGVAVGAAGSAEFPGMTPSGITWRHRAPRVFTTVGAVSMGTDLNRSGDALFQAAGYSVSSSRVERADGSVYDTGIAASALDGRGRAVGARTTGTGADFHSDAARSDGSTTTLFDAPAGRSTHASDAAEDGTACGEAFTPVWVSGPRPHPVRTERRPLLWQPNGTRVDLPALGTQSWCTATAGRDVAAGQYVREDGTEGVVLWLGGRAYPVGPEGATSRVTGMNARGQLVATVVDIGGQAQYGFVADAGGWRRLAAPGGQSTAVVDINAAGVAVGTSFATDDAGQFTLQRATRWVTR